MKEITIHIKSDWAKTIFVCTTLAISYKILKLLTTKDNIKTIKSNLNDICKSKEETKVTEE